jgi:YesN/AraC family two-component response regulator
MRRIELKRAKRYTDMRTGKMFVSNKMYTVGDNLAKRLLDQSDQRDDPYFRDHGEISKAQVNKMLKSQEAKKLAEEEAARQAELDEMGSELLDDEDPVEEADAASKGDEEITEVG